MGWDGTDQVVPWYDFVVPSRPIRNPGRQVRPIDHTTEKNEDDDK
jgi:hypothetical protein